MRDQVQRKIERRDARDRAEGKALHDAPASRGKLLPIEGQILAVNARGLFGRDVEDEHRAVHFDARQFDRLAGLLRDGAGEFVTALRNRLRHTPQHALALEGGQTTGSAERLHRGGDRSFGMLAARLDDSPDYAAIEWGAHLDDVAVVHPTAVDKEPVGCDRGDRHFRHSCLPCASSVFDYRLWLLVAFF